MKDKDYKSKLLRVFREIMLLSQSPFGLTVNELAKKLNCSYRTIYRDLELLAEVGFITEEVEKKKLVLRGMDREVKQFEKNLNFNAEEAAILSRAVAGIAESHPLKDDILSKLRSFSGLDEVMNVIVKTDKSRLFGALTTAVKEKKVAVLRDYRSSNSQSVRTREVEPYAFSRDGVFVKAFELETKENKTFKIERIGEVEVLDRAWKFQKQHETRKQEDIFGFRSGESFTVKLRMSMRAAQLLREEFPLGAAFLKSETTGEWLFEAKVNGLAGVSRFILGLIDEIKVVGPKELRAYLKDKIRNKKI